MRLPIRMNISLMNVEALLMIYRSTGALVTLCTAGAQCILLPTCSLIGTLRIHQTWLQRSPMSIDAIRHMLTQSSRGAIFLFDLMVFVGQR
jgi:hypothetical protein